MLYLWIIWIIITIYLFFIKKSYRTVAFAYPAIAAYQIPDRGQNFIFNGLGDFNEGAQNVHDTLVRATGAEKYFYLYSKIEKEYSHLGRGWMQTLKKNTLEELEKYKEFSKLHENLQHEYKFLFTKENNIRRSFAQNFPRNEENIEVTELDIFALVWTAFKKLDIEILLTQLRDCYELDGKTELVCLNGRVARYLSSFVGVTDDILGQSEITEKILFEEALRETQKYFLSLLEKAKLRDIYEKGGDEKEEENLDLELDKIRSRIKRKLTRTYPKLNEKKINEILTAI